MISKNNAEHYRWARAVDGWHLVRSSQLSVVHERMPPGSSEARDYHRTARQFFFILAGTATMKLAGRRQIVQPHEGIEIPSEVPHQLLNESNQELELLVISQPPSHSDRVLA